MKSKFTALSFARIVVKWAMRAAVVVGILFFFAVIITSTLGGKGDIARASLERVIFGMTGVHATVHELHDYRLFPEFKIDFKNMTGDFERETAHKITARPEQKLPDVILEKFIFTQSSFRHLWGSAAISGITFDNLIIRPGVFGPPALHLKTGRIVGPVVKDAHMPQPPAQFIMTGDYGGRDMVISVPLIATASRGKWYYRVDGSSDMSLRFRDIVATGRLNMKDEQMIFESIKITRAGKIVSRDDMKGSWSPVMDTVQKILNQK